MTEFKNRVFGCVVVKAINSNYNADFSGQPRTLPNGKVYATDKGMKKESFILRLLTTI